MEEVSIKNNKTVQTTIHIAVGAFGAYFVSKAYDVMIPTDNTVPGSNTKKFYHMIILGIILIILGAYLKDYMNQPLFGSVSLAGLLLVLGFIMCGWCQNNDKMQVVILGAVIFGLLYYGMGGSIPVFPSA